MRNKFIKNYRQYFTAISACTIMVSLFWELALAGEIIARESGGGFETGSNKHKTIVLGFDGLDPRLCRQWMDEGHLPNFKQLAETGDFKKLGTPRLFFGVTAGVMDSMVNHYTANK